VDVLWATKSDGVGLIVREISFQDFQPTVSVCVVLIHERYGQTDGQADVRHAIARHPSALETLVLVRSINLLFTLH